MTKNMYIQPSVKITEMVMVQALCVSNGGGGWYPNPGATTDEQL